MRRLLKEIVIAGGGSSGWMTAAALASLLDPENVSITVVESDDIGTIGVGEATIPDILTFNRLLGLSEDAFMKATEATFKLGIEFIDWGRKGDAYFHPFSGHGVDMKGVDFHQYWLHARANGDDSPIQHYSVCATAAERSKFALPVADPRSVLSHIRYAYHFDATLYARHLRRFAEGRGVKRVEGRIEQVLQAPESGNLTGLRLAGGKLVSGDFFFDCTGFRALLLEKALGVGYLDWRRWLPCDRAQAMPCSHAGPLLPYTRSKARTAGWQWRIPTQRRIGNGHIYCSEFMSDDEAASILVANLDGEPLGSPRKIEFVTGCRETFWDKNCIAIGLAAGFLEPLESTSIHLIQEGIRGFISLFPDGSLPDVVRDEYNRQMRRKFEQVRDFIILHYVATERDDTPFWNYCRTMSIPETLRHKIALFREAGRIFRYDEELFTRPSWVAVMIGQRIMPKSCDPIVAVLPPAEVRRSLESMRAAFLNAADAMPTHADFIQRYCRADLA